MSTLAAFLRSTSIFAAAATPATLGIIWLSEQYGNPFRNPGAIFKVAFAWWLGTAIGSVLGEYVFFWLGPMFVIAGFPVIVGALLNWLFEEGFWRSTWWAFASLGLLSVLFVAAQIILGRYGFGVL